LLSPREIVWGKLLASTSFSLILLASSIPLVGICFMFGGLDPLDLVKTFVLTVASILFYSSMAIFFSAASRRTVVAVVLTFVGVLAFTAGVPVLTIMLDEIVNLNSNNWLFGCMLVSSPFALATLVMPNEVTAVLFHEQMWLLHSVLHAMLAVVWLGLAARFVAYPKAKE
jgi:hypothetical protein